LLATMNMEGRIDVHDPRQELRRAVDQVGADAEKVREHLFGGFTSGGPTS
jgi:hypothetical protein